MLMDTDLNMAGYHGDAVPAMQKRMIGAMETIPGVTSVGLIDLPPLASAGDTNPSPVFTGETTDLRPASAAATSATYSISPEYFRAAGTSLLAGRSFSWHDDKNAPRVAVINQEFARKIFGSATNATGGYYKTTGWNARTSRRHRGERKIWRHHRRSAPGDVLPNPAIAIEWDDACGALEPRSAATGGSYES